MMIGLKTKDRFAEGQKIIWTRLFILILCPLSIVLCPSCKDDGLSEKAQLTVVLRAEGIQQVSEVTLTAHGYLPDDDRATRVLRPVGDGQR